MVPAGKGPIPSGWTLGSVFVLIPLDRYFTGQNIYLDHIRREIEHMRVQVGRQRKEILQLQRAGISTASAELLLGRMNAKIDGLIEQRERLKKKEPKERRVLGGRNW